MNSDQTMPPGRDSLQQAGGGSPDADTFPPDIPTDRPTSARAYGWLLGSKDNFQVDRELVLGLLQAFPESVDEARSNRRFLYRAVRYLARDVGITQFLDLGSGLPVENNVHEVAQRFQQAARVVYVDNDPIVLAHGRALLADDDSTTVIQADVTEPATILHHPEVTRLLDLSQPVGVLQFGVPHCIPDDETARAAVLEPMEHVVSGSYLAVSHVVADDRETADEVTATISGLGMPWRTRLPDEFASWLTGFEAVEPGLVDLNDWRPDRNQPALTEVDPQLRPYLGATERYGKRTYEYGGVLRKP
ncbi:SAM-dependent methyltransferase [Lipingzhangella sp. LS1_29]|uniref:SAM-dependent methyltransferase n=1 Tax=Lipingzhangella rawalii TaxID=2055835 RepID=A0ABU2HC43_9ACTN|nr:SAM-dependent methyltransferase [Lipingzhangella rawalii]MDS1272400.1 SAM-dependent methyltransferase [Lipingzhangella rawalii]